MGEANFAGLIPTDLLNFQWWGEKAIVQVWIPSLLVEFPPNSLENERYCWFFYEFIGNRTLRLDFQRIHWKSNATVGFSTNSLEIEHYGWFFYEFVGN